MIKVGITGQAGFIGTHLFNHFKLLTEEFDVIEFKDSYFNNSEILNNWVKKCDAIVHLAAMNRHEDKEVLFQTNLDLVNKLVDSMKSCNSKAHVIFSSSTQEERNNQYGKSKRECREILFNYSFNYGSLFTGLVIPNVFGPFGKPYYNSFIATFSHQLIHNEQPEIQIDSDVNLIYVSNLCEFIINKIKEKKNKKPLESERTVLVPYDFEKKVSSILNLIEDFRDLYYTNNIIPTLKDINEINLFNTFRSFIDHKERFPVKLEKHLDTRGAFVETIRLGVGGQVSFSTTFQNITRGNHFHTRKIERFTVIKGKALIQLRRIGTDEIYNFELDGNEPSFVDMPIWYTHNIKNIGEEELYTIFWINEFFDPKDPDTFFEEV